MASRFPASLQTFRVLECGAAWSRLGSQGAILPLDSAGSRGDAIPLEFARSGVEDGSKVVLLLL